MDTMTICVPLNPDGTVHDRLGQANTVAICQVSNGVVTDWTEHVVGWDATYGIETLGVHHPRVIRFLQQQHVDAVVADHLCDVMQTTLPKLGIAVHLGVTGDARGAVTVATRAA
jgi:predicted Fe-Mo cluster-binding NifX family protein